MGELTAKRQAICQRSGFKVNADELVREWTGLLVHHRFVDTRNPQDLLRAVKEDRPPRVVSPEPSDVFVSGNGPSQSDL